MIKILFHWKSRITKVEYESIVNKKLFYKQEIHFFNLKINFYKKNLKIRPIVQIHQIDSRIQKQEFERNIFLLYFFAY